MFVCMFVITDEFLKSKIEECSGKLGLLVANRMPSRPIVGTRKDSKTVREPKTSALLKNFPYIQLNAETSVQVLVFDCDEDIGTLAWESEHIPVPNFVVLHKDDDSYKSHLYYVLQDAVPTSGMQTEKQRVLFDIVQKNLRKKLHADVAFSSLQTRVKNPFSTFWLCVTCSKAAYTLKELRTYLDDDEVQDMLDTKRLQESASFREDFANAGRNCMLFETLRFYAYQERHKYTSYEPFFACIYEKAVAINDGFEVPLQLPEVKKTVKSVATWTYEKLSKVQSDRRLKMIAKKNNEKALKVKREKKEIKKALFLSEYLREGTTMKDSARKAGISERTARMYFKEYKELTLDT